MRLAARTSSRPRQAAATPAQLTLRSALASYLDEADPTPLIKALQRIGDDTTRTTIRSGVNQGFNPELNQAVIQGLIEMLQQNERSQHGWVMRKHIELLGRFDRLLGWQASKVRLAHQPSLDQMAQSLIDELKTIDSTPRHPLALWCGGDQPDSSRAISTDFLAPWPATHAQTVDHWVCEIGSELKLAVPANLVKALIDAPALTPIGPDIDKTLWGFEGVEWAGDAVPVIALSASNQGRSPLSVCILILQTPREVASEFAHFGLVCSSLPTLACAQDLSMDQHQFIDWVAVVREMRVLF